jgi:formate dehydrogenase beta subunit
MELQREPIPMLPIDRRTGITEVEVGYDEQAAVAEASRCLRCWINTIFEGNEQDATDCVLCGGCVDVCPEDCLNLVSLDRIEFTPEALAHAKASPEMCDVELDGVTADELGSITGSAMLKDETRCIRCGLCVLRCPAGTITMESFNLLPSEPTGLIALQTMDIKDPLKTQAAVPR